MSHWTFFDAAWKLNCSSVLTTDTDFDYTVAMTFILKGKQEVKVIWQNAPHGGPIPRLGVTPGGRKLYHWIPGVGVPISVP